MDCKTTTFLYASIFTACLFADSAAFAQAQDVGAVISMRQLIEADFLLPAHVNLDTARIVFQPTPMLKQPLTMQMTFAERSTGQSPSAPITVTISKTPNGAISRSRRAPPILSGRSRPTNSSS